MQTTAAAGTYSSALAAVAQAVKASGSIVQVEKEDFERILGLTDSRLVIASPSKGMFGRNQYLVPYRGFVFYLKSRDLIKIPDGFEIITAKKIWAPS